jgi:hypothetical protein
MIGKAGKQVGPDPVREYPPEGIAGPQRINSPTPAPYGISIDNLQRQTLFHKTIPGFGSEISLNRLAPGLYMVRVMNAKNQLVHRSKLVVLDPGR